jgi:hypothetical protein
VAVVGVAGWLASCCLAGFSLARSLLAGCCVRSAQAGRSLSSSASCVVGCVDCAGWLVGSLQPSEVCSSLAPSHAVVLCIQQNYSESIMTSAQTAALRSSSNRRPVAPPSPWQLYTAALRYGPESCHQPPHWRRAMRRRTSPPGQRTLRTRGSWLTAVADSGPGDRLTHEHGGKALLPKMRIRHVCNSGKY